jgi:hypothetical protein
MSLSRLPSSLINDTSCAIPPSAVAASRQDLKEVLQDLEARLILDTLAATGGHQRRAARLLGLRPTTLHEKINRLGLRDRMDPQVSATRPRFSSVSNEFRYLGRLTAGCVLTIRGVRGSVQVEMVGGTECQVIGVCRDGCVIAEHMDVQVSQSEGGVTLSLQRKASDGGVAEKPPSFAPVLALSVRIPWGVRFVSHSLRIAPSPVPGPASQESPEVRSSRGESG